MKTKNTVIGRSMIKAFVIKIMSVYAKVKRKLNRFILVGQASRKSGLPRKQVAEMMRNAQKKYGISYKKFIRKELWQKSPDSYRRKVKTGVITKKEVCSVLGLEYDGNSERYSSVTYAYNAKNGCLAVLLKPVYDPYREVSEETEKLLAEQAIKKGAKALLATHEIDEFPTFVVEPPLVDSYAALMTSIRDKFSLKTVAITGSIGKTTTSAFIYAVLNSKYKTVGAPNVNRNTERAAGRQIQKLNSSVEAYVQEVTEVGYRRPSLISQMVKPQVAVVTVVGTSHLEIIGSQQRILESCISLEEGLDENGILLLNADDPMQAEAKTAHKTLYYGIESEKADFRAFNIVDSCGYIEFDVSYCSETTHVKINCIGRHNVYGALAGFAAGLLEGMTREETVKGLSQFRARGIRQNMVEYSGCRLYMDCYNAAKESIKSSVDALSGFSTETGRKIAVIGDVAEVGEQVEEYHREIGRSIADADIDLFLLVGDNSKYTYDELNRARPSCAVYCPSREKAVKELSARVSKGDVVLFKASRSVEIERVADSVFSTWFHEEYDKKKVKTNGDGLKFKVYGDHSVLCGLKQETAEISVPEAMSGKPVTGIEEAVFEDAVYLKRINIPNTVKNIRDRAFKGTGTETITVPGNVDIIGNSAFANCGNLTEVVICEGCKHIGDSAFAGCAALKSVIIPETVEQICEDAFSGDDGLVIRGSKGTCAEEYALENGIAFEAI